MKTCGTLLLLILAGVSLTLANAAFAQEPGSTTRSETDRLVNLDTPYIPPKGLAAYHFDLRPFGSLEDNFYGSIEADYAFRQNVGLVVRATLGGTKNLVNPGFASIRHGGNEFEFLAKFRPMHTTSIAAEVGFTVADTPAQKDVFFSGQLPMEQQLGHRLTLYLVPKAVLITDNALVALGGGLHVRVTNQVAVVGDVTGMLTGDNTRSAFTGDRESAEVWGVAIRYTPNPLNYSFTMDLGVTNGLGSTTGFSMTPGLGGSAAFYFGATFRR